MDLNHLDGIETEKKRECEPQDGGTLDPRELAVEVEEFGARAETNTGK